MKLTIKHLLSCLAVFTVLPVALSSCTDENAPEEQVMDKREPTKDISKYTGKSIVHLTLTSAMAADTRSETDDDGYAKVDDDDDKFQEATDAENSLTSAYIYLWNGSDLLKSFLDVDIDYDETTEKYTLTADIELEELFTMKGQTMQVLVVGNPDLLTDLLTYGAVSYSNLPDAAKFSISDLGDGNPLGDFGTAGKRLPLVNRDKFEFDMTGITAVRFEDAKADLLAMFDDDDILDLSKGSGTQGSTGAINLERAVARVDYHDMRTDVAGETPHTENVYELGDNDRHKLELYKMQMFNVNKSSYLFRHTIEGTYSSAFGSGNDVELYGVENQYGATDKYRWIAGSDWTANGKSMDRLNPLVKTDNADYIKGYWLRVTTSSNIDSESSGVIKMVTLKENHKNTDLSKYDGYYPWRYISENTIPTYGLMSDENLITNATGIAFTFKVRNSNGEVVPKVAEGTDFELTMENGNWQAPAYDDDEKCYYLTYYGYIIHNEINIDVTQGEGDEMETLKDVPGPMKYAIVRNNIYQLSVNKIENLPDPKEPRTLFLRLDVKVIPWTVRENVFDF